MVLLFGSKWEEVVYILLEEYQRRNVLSFEYQVPELGGWAPGGTIIDFVVYKAGALRPIALFVDGARWHAGAKAPYDQIKRSRLENERGYEVMVIEDEAESAESARVWIKENIL